MYNTHLAEQIYAEIDSLNSRKDWSIYYMDDLIYYINKVHTNIETLLEWRDSEEELNLDVYNRLEKYIDIASDLEKTINRAFVKLKYGRDMYIEWD